MKDKRTQRLTVAERRQKVAELWKSGRSHREIAELVGVTKSTIGRDIDALVGEYRQDAKHLVQTHATKDLMRLERCIGALFNKVISGDSQAAHAVCKLLERKARILGYDAPTKAVHAVHGVAHLETPLSGEELNAAYESAFQRTAEERRLAAEERSAAGIPPEPGDYLTPLDMVREYGHLHAVAEEIDARAQQAVDNPRDVA